MKKRSLNFFFLAKTSLDKNFKKKNKFNLGYFCLSDNCDLNKFSKHNVLQDHWKNKNNVLKKYKYIQTITDEIFLLLVDYLNEAHNKNENENYWRIIIYPWVCFYVSTFFDRWEIINYLLKKEKKKIFYTYEHDTNKKFNEISNTLDWFYKSQSDKFNDRIFNEIIKFKNTRKIKIIKTKIKFSKNNIKIEQKSKKNFSEILDIIISKIGIYINTIFFDKTNFEKLDFIKICFKTLQIPSRNFNILNDLKINNSYNYKLRKKLNFSFKKGSDFKLFLYNQIKNYLPKSYLEDFKVLIKSNQKFLKKRLFIGSYSTTYLDRYKIFLAESKLIGSRYVFTDHGAGIHASNDSIFNHFYKISDKIICPSKKLVKKKKHSFIGFNIFKKKKKLNLKKKPTKVLINFHEFHKFTFRVPVTTPPFEREVENFKKTIQGFKTINNKLIKNFKFRSKSNFGLNSEKRFAKIFGKGSIENKSLIDFSTSINESKLVICFIPQTSYIECIFNNVPTILIGNKEGFFDTKERLQILKKLKKKNMFFNDMKEAAKFINNNWDKIEIWWNNKSLQKLRDAFLKEYYEVSQACHQNMKNLVEQELKLIKN
tara:strand:- start:9035 stop:10822 length:1788 start_codon:yes stop_codon:yes gene_type:complete